MTEEEFVVKNKRAYKKTGEELQNYLRLMRKHGVVHAKKGKGAVYKRQKKRNWEDEE